MSKDATSTLLAFLGLGLVWGATFPITKLVLPYVGPTQIVLVRVVSGFVPLLCYCMIKGQMRRAHWRLWPHFLAMSFLATTLYYIAYAWAATEMLSGVASVLSGTAPLLVFVFSAIFLPHERLNWRKATGVMIGFAGVVLVANPSGSAVSQTSVTGLLFLLLGAISLSLSFIYARKFLAQHDIPAGALVTYQLGIASLFLLVLTPKQGIEQILLTPALAGDRLDCWSWRAGHRLGLFAILFHCPAIGGGCGVQLNLSTAAGGFGYQCGVDG